MPYDDRKNRIQRGPTPVYKQVAADIAADIAAGRLAKNDALPGELTLMNAYDVSRSTIRSALFFLREHKLLVTTQGLGTFVNGTPSDAKAVLGTLHRQGAS